MNQPHTHFFMLLAATHRWRELDAAARHAVFDDLLVQVFNGYPDLRIDRYAAIDGARCSHLIVWKAGDPAQYHDAVAALQCEPFFGAPLFEVVEVIAGVADDASEAEAARSPYAALML